MAGLHDGRVRTWQGYTMVGSEQVYHPPVSQYGGSKPEVVNK